MKYSQNQIEMMLQLHKKGLISSKAMIDAVVYNHPSTSMSYSSPKTREEEAYDRDCIADDILGEHNDQVD